jgi:hypothetical protein
MSGSVFVASPFARDLAVIEMGDRFLIRCRCCGAQTSAPKTGLNEVTLAHERECSVLLAASRPAGRTS